MSRSRSAIAIDIGDRAVRLLQLERRGGTLRVRAAAAEALEPAATPPDANARRAQVVEAARRALRRGGFRGDSAVTALRLRDIATRHVRIANDELERAGDIIAQKVQDPTSAATELAICPIPVAELFDQGERKREFLCCIARADAIRALIETTEAIGLVPDAVDLEPCALVRPFVRCSPGDSFLHLDIGDSDTRITVVRAGNPILMRIVRTGAADLSDLLRERLQIDVDRILEPADADTASSLHYAIVGALAAPLERLLVRVTDGVRYCGALFQGRAVNLMRVSGRPARWPGLVAYLGRRAGITTERAEPFAGIEPPPSVGNGEATLAGFDTALGLALRSVAS
ncbi:MAG: pilus assembly protein PilM [Planctomycetes bacterium]|nr:pilus assembly protein PilM [Planctomycetota bacterium]